MTEAQKDAKIIELEEWKSQALIGHNLLMKAIKLNDKNIEIFYEDSFFVLQKDLQYSVKLNNIVINDVNEATLKQIFKNKSNWASEDDDLIYFMDESSFIRTCIEFQLLNKYSDLEVESLLNISFKEIMKVIFDTFLLDKKCNLSQEEIKKVVIDNLLKKGFYLK
jgi:hypothetical protein